MHSSIRSFSLMISAAMLLHAAFLYPVLSIQWVAFLIVFIILLILYMVVIYKRYFSDPLAWEPVSSLYKIIFIQVLPQFFVGNMLALNMVCYFVVTRESYSVFLVFISVASIIYCWIVRRFCIVYRSDSQFRFVNMYVDRVNGKIA